MDKKISRYFHLQWQEPQMKDDQVVKPGFHFLVMQSEFEGEFGIVRHRVVAKLDGDLKMSTVFLETSGEKPEVLFFIRNVEVSYFFDKILPLFNPLSLIQDALPFPSSPES
jgi:hypothetical protein